jgi:hypothetical protein
MDKPFTRAFLALVTSLFLTAPVALAQEPVTGAMVRHRNAAFVQTMVRHVAQTHHIPAERMKAGHETSKVLPLTGKTLYQAKILDTTAGKAYDVAADETGAIVDADSLRDAERRAYAARYGNPSPFRGAIPMARSRPGFSSGWSRRAVTRLSPFWCGWTTAARCRLHRT